MSEPERFGRVPKVELHLHAAGSVRPATMRELVSAAGGPPALADAYTTATVGEGLTAYLARFAAWDAALRTPERVARVIGELCADLATDGVCYAEIRFRPPADEDESWHAMMRAAVDSARAAGAPEVNFIAVVLRGWSADRAEREARRASEWAGRGVVALDVAGDEAIGGLSPLAPALHLAREAGLGITVHAGETQGAPAVREALDLIGPDRIAHGVGAAADSDLVIDLRARGTHLEMAMRSNVQTGAVSDLAHHPFSRLLRSGISVGLSTDNRTISGTTLSDEYALAESLGLTWSELARASLLAAGAAFLPVSRREGLAHEIQEAWRSNDVERTPGRIQPRGGLASC